MPSGGHPPLLPKASHSNWRDDTKQAQAHTHIHTPWRAGDAGPGDAGPSMTAVVPVAPRSREAPRDADAPGGGDVEAVGDLPTQTPPGTSVSAHPAHTQGEVQGESQPEP